jgi:hypothetical protein
MSPLAVLLVHAASACRRLRERQEAFRLAGEVGPAVCACRGANGYEREAFWMAVAVIGRGA